MRYMDGNMKRDLCLLALAGVSILIIDAIRTQRMVSETLVRLVARSKLPGFEADWQRYKKAEMMQADDKDCGCSDG